jgi:hypothetical protein
VDWLLQQREGARALLHALRRPLIAGLLLIAVLVAGVQVEYMHAGNIDLQPQFFTTLFPAGGRLLLFGGILALMLACNADRLIRPSAAGALLLAFTVLDLWTAESGSILFVDPSPFYQSTAISTLVHDDPASYRVLTLPAGAVSRTMPYRQGMVSGDIYDAEDFAPITMSGYWTLANPKNPAHPISKANARDLITCYDPSFADLLSVTEVVTAAPFTSDRLCQAPNIGKPHLVLLGTAVTESWEAQNGTSWNPSWFQDIAYVYRNTAALPRAFLVPAGKAMAQPSAARQLDAVQDPRFDGAHRLLYDPGVRPVPLGLDGLQHAWASLLKPVAKQLPSDLPAGQARVLADDGNSVQVAVHATRPSFLVLDDT